MKKNKSKWESYKNLIKEQKGLLKGGKIWTKKGECEENLGTGRGEELVIGLVKTEQNIYDGEMVRKDERIWKTSDKSKPMTEP